MKNYKTYTDKFNDFARDLLLAVLGKEGKNNVVVSPLSVIAALCMTARATSGNTREEILSCISDGRSLDEMISVLKEIILKAEKNGSLKMLMR